VQELRSFGKLKFIVLKDREGFFQATLPQKVVSAEIFQDFDKLTKESCLLLEGTIQKAKQVQAGWELIPDKMDVLGLAKAPTPIDMSGKITSDLSVRLDYRFLDLRDPKKIAIFKIRGQMVRLSHEYFLKNGFINIQTPKLTTAGAESGATLFEVKYFKEKAFLSQSPQLYKQMGVLCGMEKVYDIGAVFRAESSHTTRHVTEFTGIDFEMGHIKSEDDVMDVIEDYMKFLIKGLNQECKEQLELLDIKIKVPKKIPRVPMAEAKQWLAEKGKKLPPEADLDPEGEKMLGEMIQKKFKEDFVFVTLFPWEQRPFYHMRPEGDPTTTKSFDLLWNGLEVATGSQREHRIKTLEAQAKEKGVNLKEMKDYAIMFEYGALPHGGVGMGLDRFIEAALGLDNIREGIYLPRDPLRLTP
jgi:aspartyl-tRNA synthetase